MKNFFADTDIKGTIVLGIITSIICVYLVQPIINICFSYTGNIITTLINYYYTCAAIADGIDTILHFWIIIFFTGSSILIIRLYNALKISRETPNSSEKKEKTTAYLMKRLKLIRIIIILDSCCIGISVIFLAIFSIFPNFNKISFDQSITKITPYVELSEIDMLKSDWVRMKTKEDFDIINQKINNIIKDNKLD